MHLGRSRALSVLATLAIVASACSSSSSSSAAPNSSGLPATVDTSSYPRAETLYTGGKQWGPPSTWNPLDPNTAMGVVGLQYETLFLYNPIDDKWTPWLATGGDWDSAKTTYTIHVRQGVKWSDGSDMTAADVAFSLNVTKNKAIGVVLGDLLNTVTVSGNDVVVTFNGTPAYQEFSWYLYNQPIIPEKIWSPLNNADILKTTNQNGVGTGPYTYKTAAQDRMVWQRNDNWWAKSALSLEAKPKYIVDMVNSSNNVALGQVLSGAVDLNNNYLPGISQVINGGYGVTTYFDKAPYMFSGNTAWLIPNTKHTPLDDPAFRKALAEAINPDDVVNTDYGGIVAKSDPTGLLPAWDKYIDHAQAQSIGVSYDLTKAKADLDAAGYKVGSDGFVTNKDGSPIDLKLEVPDGWSDWMEATTLIAASAAQAGIKITPTHPDFGTLVNDRNGTDQADPTFDLVIANDVQIGNSPWVYYDYIFRQPQIAHGAARNRNYEQYDNADAWALVQKLDQTPTDDVTTMQSICSQLQKIQLTDEPVIPLWYNGVWSQVTSQHWTNWPSEKTYQVLPATWNGYWQMGAIYILTNIQSVPAS
jgi:peptide/nickel transport system substrate-binding protein